MKLRIKRSGPHTDFEAEVTVPKEVWATRSPLKVAEFITRELTIRWAIAKGFEYNSPQALNYYAGMIQVILPLVREEMIKAMRDFTQRVREIKGAT